MSTATQYELPSSPSYLCQDRFSILDSDEYEVPFWHVFTKLMEQPVTGNTQLVDLLETISATLQWSSCEDYGRLRHIIDLHPDFFSTVWPSISALATELSSLFPDHCLPVLSDSQSKVELSRRQVACLVVHQFLCTLRAPPWQDGFQDFHIWYASEQPHGSAVDAYLTALMTFFARLAENEPENEVASYTMYDSCLASEASLPFIPLDVLRIPEASTVPSLLGLPDGASVISANKFVGFGRTGTQEETHVGASPECCPAVLMTPPLEDHQVLVVQGAEAMIAIAGYGRDAKCAEILQPAEPRRWSKRSMLFMDALELDVASTDRGLPDLLEGNVERERRKALTAFCSSRYSTIFTGFWGCRTFGGNPDVKSLVQWIAASQAQVGQLNFICSGPEQSLFAERLEAFRDQILKREVDVSLLLEALLKLEPQAGETKAVFDRLLADL